MNRGFGFNEISEQLDIISAKFGARGIAFHGASRISAFKRNFKLAADSIMEDGNVPDSIDMREIVEGMRDFFELESISSAGLIEKIPLHELRIIAKGRNRTALDKDTRPRDFQYQYFLTALFRNTGIEAEVMEPDMSLKIGTMSIPVAVKRLSGNASISTRIDEAVNQICHGGQHGVIALSLDRLVSGNQKYGSYVVVNDASFHFEKAANDIMQRFLREEFRKYAPAVLQDSVIGMITTLSMPTIIPSSYSFGTGVAIAFMSTAETEPDFSNFSLMAKYFSGSIME